MTRPALRFPEFTDAWAETTLGNIATFSKGKGISKADISKDGATPCIRYGELYTTYGTAIDDVVSATNVPKRSLRLSRGNEVIVPASGETAEDIATASVVRRAGVALGGDLNIIDAPTDGYFLASYLSGKKRMDLASMAQGNSVVHLYPSQLARLPIFVPDRAEQAKIAALLEAMDSKIDALRQKEAGLKQFKAGLMQKLFSQELRFKRDDGSDFPEWVEYKLGDLSKWSSGGTPAKDNPEYWNGDVPWVSALGMHSQLIHDTPLRVTRSAIGRGTRLTGAGSILMLVRGSMLYNRAPICMAAKEMAFNQDVKAIRALEPASSKFLFYWLMGQESTLMSMVTGTGIGAGKLDTNELQELLVELPDPEEQQKISDVLSVLDVRLNGLHTQIAHMETFKKGLLQQMFA